MTVISSLGTYKFIATEMNKVEAALSGARENIAENPVESFRLSRLAQSTFVALHEELIGFSSGGGGYKATEELDKIATEIQREAYKNMGPDADKTLRNEFNLAVVEVPHPIKNSLRKLLGNDPAPNDIQFRTLKIPG